MKRAIYFQSKGVVGLELMVVLSVLLIGLTIAVPLFLNRSEINRNNLTYQKMIAVKQAIVGDPQRMVENSRSSFGFVGDLGVLPDITTLPSLHLIDLVENRNDKYPYHQASPQNIWYGWRGPYLETPMGDDPYVSIYDAWGRPLQLNAASGIDPYNGKTRVSEIRSTGLDPSVTVTDDDIILYIYEEDLSNYVSGDFLDAVSKTIITSYNGQLSIYYPNGTSPTLVQTTVNITNGQYDTDTIIKIPVGHRYFETQDLQYFKIITLNGGGDSIVNFYASKEPTLFEHDFSNEDDLTILGEGGGSWKTDTDANGDYLAYTGNANEGDHVVTFGNPAWTDYTVEVEVSITDSNKIDGFGIDYRANYSGDPTPDSGYRFTYYAEAFSHFTLNRLPTDFVPPEPNHGGYDFGYFKFTISVQTNPTTIAHTIKIEKKIAGVLVTQTTVSIDENRTGDSVLSGQVGLMVFGQLQSIRLHHITVSPL